MSLSNFNYLETEFPILYNIGLSAEYNLHTDAVVCIIKLRQFVERLTETLFEEHCLEFPRDNTIHNRLKTLEFEDILPTNIKDLLFIVKNKGNIAVHQNKGSLSDAKSGLHSVFKIAKWFYNVYSEKGNDIVDLRFHIPENQDARQALNDLEKDYKALEAKFEKLLAERSTEGLATEDQIRIKEKSNEVALKIDMSEAETRQFIDQQLEDAGWEVDTETLNFKSKKTLPQRGKNIAIAEWPTVGGWADYALFIGTKLYAIVEAKKYGVDISSDLTQAKRYAEKVEEKNESQFLGTWRRYHVPFLFSTNGREFLEQLKTKSGIWFLDVRKELNIARPLRGWPSPEGLIKLYEQDIEAANKSLKDSDLSYLKSASGLNLRYYQIKAIQKVEERLIKEPHQRKALLAMATGTGKTRTIMGLCYRLIKSNRFKRILFLVDRRLLALQAFDSFKDNKVEDINTFAETYEVKSLKDAIPDVDTRLHFATVQGMVKRLFYTGEEGVKLSVDTYDCIIVDEAHRGYLLDKEMDEEELGFKNQMDYVSKYRMVLDYFDAFAVGLTATPALHTSEIFGKPIFNYSYREAVIDGFLVDQEPPILIKTKLSEEGIVWEKGSRPEAYDKETNEIIELEELEDELHIEIEGFNKLVITESFNRTVIKELIKHIDPEGEEKTLIFAARDAHADLIVNILKEEFDKTGGVPDDAIIKLTGKSDRPKELLRRFKNEKYPNIVVTVDLLTTGIDVPSISNLVFLRRIKSRILYEQMKGRATRLCPEINKEAFKIFDAVRIYEALEDYTSMKPVSPDPKTSFGQLAEEMDLIKSSERTKKQVEQIIAKLHRKKQYIKGDKEELFKYNAEGKDPAAFINMLKDLSPEESPEKIMQFTGLWKFLDEFKPSPRHQLISGHQDEYLTTERGYGDFKKPEDYIESFEKFIKENQSKIEALNIICTRPSLLDRKSLKELKLELDQAGFNSKILDVAWKDVKNEAIVADIISYIRTLALGSALVSHEQRIHRAVDKVRALKDWNKRQIKWIDRFEKQLLAESVIQLEDLNQAPFSDAGGYDRLNKIFENELETVLHTINENLYQESA